MKLKYWSIDSRSLDLKLSNSALVANINITKNIDFQKFNLKLIVSIKLLLTKHNH